MRFHQIWWNLIDSFRPFHLSFLPSVLRHALLSIRGTPVGLPQFRNMRWCREECTGRWLQWCAAEYRNCSRVSFCGPSFLISLRFNMKFSRCSWVCVYGRGSMADLLSDVGLFDTGTDYAVLPGKKLRNENADTCQAIAFLCLHIFILLCANIIPKATNTVKGITS